MGKRLKDPIYDYIEIDEEMMRDVVDTSCFQRLRYITQTSYAPLYSAAVHNRFIHSLGVLFLGNKAIDSVVKSAKSDTDLQDITDKEWNRYKKTFLLACLLHDVGHAPFSHSGEEFYLYETEENGMTKLDFLLLETVNESKFSSDFQTYYQSRPAAPHERMSVIVAIKNYSELFQKEQVRDFFARCITGYLYINPNKIQQVLNCFIELLNSSIIDVDKLDYLIRDSFISGFKSVEIDYERLLSAIIILKTDKGYKLAYHKGAISIIENVIFAHDAERKWIQNHPIVIYESFLIQYSIKELNKEFKRESGSSLFCYQAITAEGKDFNKAGKIRLLSDDDVIYLIKNKYDNLLSDEIFDRDKRRHPIWKSEAEYNALFDRKYGPEILDAMEAEMEQLDDFLENKVDSPIINDTTMFECQKQIDDWEKLKNDTPSSVQEANTNIELLKKHYSVMKCLKEYADEFKLPFDFVLLRTKKFSSGFGKAAFEDVLIDFPNLKKNCKFKKVVTGFNADETVRSNMFYLYQRRLPKGKENPIRLVKKITDIFNESE